MSSRSFASSLALVAFLASLLPPLPAMAQTVRPTTRDLHQQALGNAGIPVVQSSASSSATVQTEESAKITPAISVASISSSASPDIADLPAFPEDATRPVVDLSTLDWDAQFTPPDLQEEYIHRKEQLESEGKFSEANKLKPKMVTLTDPEADSFVRPNETMKAAIKKYREGLAAAEKEDATIWTMLFGQSQESIKKKHEELKAKVLGIQARSQNVSAEDANVQDIGTLKEVPAPVVVTTNAAKDGKLNIATSSEVVDGLPAQTLNAIPRHVEDLLLKQPGGSKQSAFLHWLVPKSYAGESPELMTYYQGIEDHPIDLLLLNLTESQNADGSFGTENLYAHTFRIAELLSQMDKQYTREYAKMIDYLQKTTPVNNRDKALKVRLLVSMNQSSAALMDDLSGQFTAVTVDGSPRLVGIGFLPGHTPDIETMIAYSNASLVSGLHTDLLPYTIIWISNQIDPTGYIRYNVDAYPSYHLVNSVAQQLMRFRGLSYTFGGQTIVIDQKIALLLSYLRSAITTDGTLLKNDHAVVDELMTLGTFQMHAGDSAAIHALYDGTIRKQHADGSFGATLYDSEAALAALRQTNLKILDPKITQAINYESLMMTATIQNIGQLPLWSVKLHLFADGHFLGTQTIALASPLLQYSKRDLQIKLPKDMTDTLVGPTKLTFYMESPSDGDENDNWLQSSVSFAAATTQQSGILPPATPLLTGVNFNDSSDGQLKVVVKFVYRTDARRSDIVLIMKNTVTNQVYSTTVPTSGATVGTIYAFTATVPAPFGNYTIQLAAKSGNGTLFAQVPVTLDVNSSDFVGSADFHAQQHSLALPLAILKGVINPIQTDEFGDAYIDRIQTGMYTTYVDNPQSDKLIYRYFVDNNKQTTVWPVITHPVFDNQPPTITAVRVQFGTQTTSSFHAGTTLNVEVAATDNTGLQKAITEYWNPADSQWHALADVPFETSTLAVYTWKLPPNLVGNGFKVRAKVVDGAGNASDFLESVPFKIIASSIVSIDGLTNNQWNLGESKTVRFDFSTIPNVDGIDGFYIVSGAYKFNLTNQFITGSQFVATIPLDASRLSDEAYLEARIYSNSYLTTTVAFSPLFAVTDSLLPPSPPWHTPTVFIDPAPSSLLFRSFKSIQERSDGGIDVVYSEVDGVSTLVSKENRRLIFRSLRSGIWQPPVIIAEHQVSQQDDRKLYENVSVVFRPEGARVLFRTVKDNDSSKTEILFVTILDRTVTVESVTDGVVKTLNPTMALSSDAGTVIATWEEKPDPALQTNGQIVVRRKKDASWQPKELLASLGSFPIAIVQGSNVSLIYQSAGLQYRLFDGSNWQPVQPVLGKNGNSIFTSFSPLLFENADASLHMFFRDAAAGTGFLHALRLQRNGTGSSLQTIEDNSLVDTSGQKSVEFFNILQGKAGQYHILYVQDGASSSVRKLAYVSLDQGKVLPGTAVFAANRFSTDPILAKTTTNLIAFARVQTSGFDRYKIQRNYAARTDVEPVTQIPAPVIVTPIEGSTVKSLLVPVRGTTQTGTTVRIYSGSTLLTSLSATGGVWAGNITLPSDGTYYVTALAQDSYGNTSDSVSRSFIVQTITPSPTPVVYLPLNETSGPTAFDSSGNAHHAQYENAPIPSTDVPSVTFADARSILLNGTNNLKIPLPSLNLRNTTTVTYTAWIKNNNPLGVWPGIVESRNTSNGLMGMLINPQGKLGYSWRDASSSWGFDSNLSIPKNKWVFVAVSVEPTKATLTMINNGVIQTSVNTIAHAPANIDGDLHIGYDPAAADRHFIGNIDDVRVYNATLSVDQLQAVAQAKVVVPPAAPTISTPSEGSTSTTSSVVISGTTETGTTVDVYSGALLLTSIPYVKTTWSGSFVFSQNGLYHLTAIARTAQGNLSDPVKRSFVVRTFIASTIPTLYLKLDETSGPTAFDSSGNAHHAQYENAPIPSTDVPPVTFTNTRSIALNGTNNLKVPAPSVNLQNTKAITYTAWIKNNNALGSWPGIVETRNASFGLSGLLINPQGKIGYSWVNAANTWGFDSGLIVPKNQWVFVAVSIDSTKATVSMINNGVLQTSVNAVTHVPTNIDGDLHIGYDPAAADRHFIGNIDDVHVFNAALSNSEILAVAQASAGNQPSSPTILSPAEGSTVSALSVFLNGTTETGSTVTVYSGSTLLRTFSSARTTWSGSVVFPQDGTYKLTAVAKNVSGIASNPTIRTFTIASNGLIAHWKLDEVVGTNALDASGNGLLGAYEGNPVSSTDVPTVNFADIRSLSLNGTSRVHIPAPSVNLQNTKAITYTAWIKNNNPLGSWPGIVESRNSSTGLSGLLINAQGKLAYSWNNAANTWGFDSGIVIPKNQWVFVAVTIEPTKATIALIQNGVVQSTVNTISHSSAVINGDLYLGYDPVANDRHFIGNIDDVRVYSRSLSAAELKTVSGQ